jgi:D-threo-aldose 1-dehydrogenase
MLAGGYTLLEHAAADEFLSHCERSGIGVVVASPFNSGILATGAVPGATFFYQEAAPDVVERVKRLHAVCARHDVPLGAAALQFTLAHPAIVCAVCGYRNAAEVDTNLRWVDWPIPAALWEELRHERLIPTHVPVPAGTR